MQSLLADTCIGITELKKNPSAVIRDAGTQTVVVLHHNKPSAYLVPAASYEALMDVLDDLQLGPLVQQRIQDWQTDPENVIEVSLDELRHIARGVKAKVSPPANKLTSKPTNKSASKPARTGSATATRPARKR